jgi:tRNA A-37 threonylcarbamoyl transferase component Bud32
MTTATPVPTPPAPEPIGASRIGQVLSGRYRISSLLGEGGMGSVFLAEHIHMKKRFAVKLLHPEMAGNEEVVARFRREAQAAAHVEHPNVVAASDFGQTDDGAFFLVLEYVDGTSLRDALGAGAFPASRALRIIRQVALGLERAHAFGIVHRDLKPENVMLVRKENEADFVKVLDFGVARFDPNAERGDGQQPLTRVGTVIGTPEYMAPEQALGERVGAGSDLYAVGVILYELLAGMHPFDGDTMAMMSKHIIAPIPPIRERAANVDVPAPVEAVVMRLLQKDVHARYANARALVVAIDEAAAMSGIDAGGAPPASERLKTAKAPEVPSAKIVPSAVVEADVASAATRAAALVAMLRSRLEPLARSLRSGELYAMIPTRARIAIAAGAPLFILFVLVTVILARRAATPLQPAGLSPASSGTSASDPSERQTATADAIRSAAVKGPAAVEALAAEFPADPAVLRELALAYDSAGRTADALRAVRLAASADRDGLPPELVRIVVRAASKPDSSDEAFGLLQDSLGAEGLDALVDLAGRKDVPPATRARASKVLADPGLRAAASPAPAVFLDLVAAPTCEARRELLSRARERGDARALAPLRALRIRRGCGSRGRHDCNACLRIDGALELAIDAVEARARK